ncbi:unnamed protein product [Gongylonema pulchrum]|uniref:RNA-splicing ligase RtcB n=1 Tax=Gongylonema pulchrum TaxID=637853 RepID=A0A183DWV4_9BILA|nr:unnamed protein product [Gongylonema pulchrum]
MRRKLIKNRSYEVYEMQKCMDFGYLVHVPQYLAVEADLAQTIPNHASHLMMKAVVSDYDGRYSTGSVRNGLTASESETK